jgi:hypothetical protein
LQSAWSREGRRIENLEIAVVVKKKTETARNDDKTKYSTRVRMAPLDVLDAPAEMHFAADGE